MSLTLEALKERVRRVQPHGWLEEDMLRRVNVEVGFIEDLRCAAAARREMHILESKKRVTEKVDAAGVENLLLPTACWVLHGLDVDAARTGDDRGTGTDRKYEYLPARPLIERLEATEAGCEALLGRWRQVHEALVRKCGWIADDVFTVIRLMGKRPMDAHEDPDVAAAFMAADAFDRSRDNAFIELRNEIGFARAKELMSRASELAASRFQLGDPEQGRAAMMLLVESAMNRLHAKSEQHRLYTESDEAREAAGREFDESATAQETQRREKQWIRIANESLNGLLKLQRYSRRQASGSRAGAGDRADGSARETMKREQSHAD